MKFNCAISDVTDNMISVTDYNVYWWSLLYWESRLDELEESLENNVNQSEDMKAFYKYSIVEAKKLIVEIYNKLLTFKECQGLIQKPYWMDNFLNVEP